ncbi:MAG: low molecular weight phosphotyrosine protein phosphatase [Alphaproteobacteria bacterium]|nr:low molecular weight phosphotyrosine protein phosphatase [Alphaproteobacteria bacterium]
MKVLFVCTGNICRSPTAEAVFRHKVEEAGLSDYIEIDSAGTHNWHAGGAPDDRSVYIAMKNGYSMDGIFSRQVSASDYNKFDYIFGMDVGHVRTLVKERPEDSSANIELFLDVVEEDSHADVSDPYYGGQDGFENVLKLIEEGSDAIIEKLVAEYDLKERA